MTLEQLQDIQPSKIAVAHIGPALSDGEVDPICSVREGRLPSSAEDHTRVFVAVDADSYDNQHGRLGAVAVEVEDGGSALPRLELQARRHSKLAEDPALLHGVLEVVLGELDIDEVVVASSDTNLPASFLRRAGFSALEQTIGDTEVLEFKAAA